jgi:hypothetical protein
MNLLVVLTAAAFFDSTAQSTAALTTIRVEKNGKIYRFVGVS